jgi:hypothetical protein
MKIARCGIRFSVRSGPLAASARLVVLAVACVPMLGATCSGIDLLLGPLPAADEASTSLTTAIAVVKPVEATTAALGANPLIQWADIATIPGTVVRVSAQRQDEELAEDLEGEGPIHLVGDGTTGSGRDALADGKADEFEWDIAGVRVGDYVITVTIEAPDGTTAVAVSRDEERGTEGVVTVTTALPVPTLNFSAPGAGDVTVSAGDMFEITWTDNGTANTEALLTLGLDTDDEHQGGNEYILLRDQPLSDRDDTGQFTFNFLDQHGDAVPDDTYTVFAILDDNANDPVTVEATGKLIAGP